MAVGRSEDVVTSPHYEISPGPGAAVFDNIVRAVVYWPRQRRLPARRPAGEILRSDPLEDTGEQCQWVAGSVT